MEDWIGIYKGLRLPILGLVLIYIIYYVFKPKNKNRIEKARYSMLDDDLDQGLSEKFEKQNKDDLKS